MRFVFALLAMTAPAAAWEFTADPICTVTGGDADVSVELTYDPVAALYQIALTRPDGWTDAPRFAIAFGGTAGLTITTDRHQISGSTLSVGDTGFGNVLFGMESGGTALAQLGADAVSFSLEGAAPEIEKFRACGAANLV